MRSDPMPTRKAKIRRAKHHITSKAIAAFQAGDFGALHRALALKPWESSPLWVQPGDEQPEGNSMGSLTWPKAMALRLELEAAVKVGV
jgi:hypothetical protein